MKLSEFNPTKEALERVRKCTTAEEVEKLAREYDVELTDEEIADVLEYSGLKELKELNDEQLDQVAGGDDWGDKKGKHLPANHGKHIGKYEAQGYKGEIVYCVRDDHPEQFCSGILMRSNEVKFIWGTNRVYDIRIQGWNHDTDRLYAYDYNDSAEWRHVQVGEILGEIDADKSTLFLYNK